MFLVQGKLSRRAFIHRARNYERKVALRPSVLDALGKVPGWEPVCESSVPVVAGVGVLALVLIFLPTAPWFPLALLFLPPAPILPLVLLPPAPMIPPTACILFTGCGPIMPCALPVAPSDIIRSIRFSPKLPVGCGNSALACVPIFFMYAVRHNDLVGFLKVGT